MLVNKTGYAEMATNPFPDFCLGIHRTTMALYAHSGWWLLFVVSLSDIKGQFRA